MINCILEKKNYVSSAQLHCCQNIFPSSAGFVTSFPRHRPSNAWAEEDGAKHAEMKESPKPVEVYSYGKFVSQSFLALVYRLTYSLTCLSFQTDTLVALICIHNHCPLAILDRKFQVVPPLALAGQDNSPALTVFKAFLRKKVGPNLASIQWTKSEGLAYGRGKNEVHVDNVYQNGARRASNSETR
jgi:hypothetical protein